MKKLFLILFCATFLNSCSFKEPQPIEKYQGKGFVLVEEPVQWNYSKVFIKLKNTDSIVEVCVHPFDIVNLKIGDTIKSARK